MKLVEDVYRIAESFMKSPDYVVLKPENINQLAKQMKENGKIDFYPPDKDQDVYKGIILELVAASVNYCYWYGRHDIRPNGSNSTKMYELLMTSFDDFKHPNLESFSICIEKFIKALAINRFPLIEERARHLRELGGKAIELAITIENRYNIGIGRDVDMEYILSFLVENFPGFASDIFLKRASLFIIQLFRRFGWLEDELHELHVPADYQLPKMLKHFGCIDYYYAFDLEIQNHNLIPKHSQAECEVRSATILAMKELCKLTGWNVAEVDAYLFLRRHECNDAFHLCITTDY
jgi:hypothetical protein